MCKHCSQPSGSFYSGHISSEPDSPRSKRRRVLVYVSPQGRIGASPEFDKHEAMRNATTIPQVRVDTLLPARILTQVLHAKGFPTRSVNDCLDDTTATLIAKEFSYA